MSRLRRILVLAGLAAVFAGMGATPLGAQAEPQMVPPKVLVVYLGHPAPGKGMAATNATIRLRDLFAAAKWPTHLLTVYGVTGEDRVAVYVGYNSFADWEKDHAALESSGKLMGALDRAAMEWSAQMKDSSTFVFKYVPELSYQPAVPVKGIRYFTLDLVRLRVGKDREFIEAEKQSIAAHAKAKIDEHWAAYELVAGAPEGNYVFFAPQASLAEWDRAEANHGKAYRDAFGGEEKWNKFIGALQSSIESVEMNLMAINPAASYVPEEWVKADPEFWAPTSAAMPAARKGARKPAKPAAKE